MTAKEHLKLLPKSTPGDSTIRLIRLYDIQAILDDGRRQGMLEAAELSWNSGEDSYRKRIRSHAAKLFTKATNEH